MRWRLRATAIAVAVSGLLSPIDPATSSTVTVPSEKYPTIQAGIDATAPGDTVLVAPGTYRGEGNRNVSFGGRSIVVHSEGGSGVTVLDVAGSAADPGRGFQFNSGEPSEAVLEGFTILNGFLPFAANSTLRHELSGAGLTIQFFASPTIRDVVVRDCHSDFTGGGISIERFSHPILVGCAVTGCSAGLQGGGISIETNSSASIDDCLILGNDSPRGGGLACSAVATLTGCTVAGNQASEGGGIWATLPAQIVIENGVVWNNCADAGPAAVTTLGSLLTWRCSLVDSSQVVVEGIVEYESDIRFLDPGFCGAQPCQDAPSSDGDYRVHADSPANSENSACGQRIGALDIGCFDPPATIETSWGAIKRRFGREELTPD